MKSTFRLSRSKALLVAFAIVIHILFCLSLHYEFLNPFFYITTHSKGQGGAFFGIYQAGVNLLNGNSIYSCENYKTPKETAVPHYHFYRYIPFPAYVSSIVSKILNPWPAYWIWIVINEAMLVLCIFLTLRLRRVYGAAAIVAAVFWLLYSPLYVELYMGQFCFTMTFLIFMLLYPSLKKGGNIAAIGRGAENEGIDCELEGGAETWINSSVLKNPEAEVDPPAGVDPPAEVDPVAGSYPAAGTNPAEESDPVGEVNPATWANPAAGANPVAPGAYPAKDVHPATGANPAKGSGPATEANPASGTNYTAGANPARGTTPAVKARKWLPPLSWILSVLLKTFTALYTITLVRMGKKKLAATGMAAIVITSVPYFISRPDDLRWFLHLNFQPLLSKCFGGYLGFSALLKNTSEHLLSSIPTGGVDLVFFDVALQNIPLMIVLAAIVTLTLLLSLRPGEIDPLRHIALWTLTFFLVFKDIWEYHYVMLIPVFVGFYLRTRSRYILTLFILLAIPTPFFLYDVPASNDPQSLWSAPLSLMHHSFKAIPTLLLYVWIVGREIKDMGGLAAIFSLKRGPSLYNKRAISP